jgi:PAS domain-containing protein
VERAPQKNLQLILARELASNLATPVFLIDPEGTLVYFNEPGAVILGRPFGETGELRQGEWGARWAPRRLNGDPYPVEELPLVRALREGSPEHGAMIISGDDGVDREIEVTALPLFAKADDFVGALAIFWEHLPAEA